MSIVNSIRARRQLKMRQRHPEQPGLRKEQKIQENKGYYPTLKQTCARIFYTFCAPLAFFQLIYLGFFTGPTKYLSSPMRSWFHKFEISNLAFPAMVCQSYENAS